LPRPITELVLVALFVAAICAVLYYLQLCWVSVMQFLLAFVLFSFSALCPLSSSQNVVLSGIFDLVRSDELSYLAIAMIKIAVGA